MSKFHLFSNIHKSIFILCLFFLFLLNTSCKNNISQNSAQSTNVQSTNAPTVNTINTDPRVSDKIADNTTSASISAAKPTMSTAARASVSQVLHRSPTFAPLPNVTPMPLDPTLDVAYQNAYALFHSSNYSAAIKAADKVLLKDPQHYKALNIKGIALCFSDNFPDGMRNIDASLSIAPGFGYARFNKALAYSYNKRFDEALHWYDSALAVENYVWSHYGKAAIYGQKSDVTNAVKNLKIAIEMDKGVKDVAKGEKDFNPVRNSKEFKELFQ